MWRDGPPRILIVDDESAARDSLEAILAGDGYELLFAEDGLDGLRQAKASLPDVILLDVMMPNLDGFEVCRRLRADPELAEAPILLLTALDDRSSRLEGQAALADDFVSKPYDGLELRARMRTITRLNRYRRLHASAAELASLSQRLLEAQERERRAVARELHDEIGQALTAVKLDLQAMRRAASPEELARQLENSLGAVEGVLQQVRSLSLELRPSLLDDLGLVAALRWYLDRQAQRNGFMARLVTDLPEERLPATVETVCFRVAQEALTNIARHAHASEVRLALSHPGGDVCLAVSDNGVGFEVGAARARAVRGDSLGLLGMEERVRLVGGALEIHSTPGHGTQVTATLPAKT